ncbi:MAG: UDP-3-O-[3-hydroxymyristoyl] glucosamine N-acyltransferase [Salibacteraceae bacterium]|jgi:UDP-3-O-[3-hydroxymyristoyl] glucosamine N-acyltransferase
MPHKIRSINPLFFEGDFIGDSKSEATNIAGLDDCNASSVVFYRGDDIAFIESKEVAILLIDEKMAGKISHFNSGAIVFCENPKYHWVKVISDNYTNSFEDSGSQIFHESVELSSRSLVESNVTIGQNTRVYPYSVLAKDSVVGSDCEIQYGSVIGGIGLGDVWHQGKYHKFVHLGKVIIGDSVSIGVNVTVLKGMLEDTLIGNGTKIGNNVNVGHNVVIGQNCYISSGVTIGGACVIENNVWISPGAVINDHVTMKAFSKAGTGSVIIKDTLENSFYLGNPARKISQRND